MEGSEVGGTRRRVLITEMVIVLSLGLGKSAVFSVLAFVRSSLAALSTGGPLSGQTTRLNTPRADDAVWDAIYQLANALFAMAPVALALFLLGRGSIAVGARCIMTPRGSSVSRTVLRALTLAACIGVPGLALYVSSRLAGLSLTVAASDLGSSVMMVPLLLVAAARAAIEEELVVVGYLVVRLRQLGLAPWAIVACSAGLRGLYHLYQGPGMMLGNMVMGVVFAIAFLRWRTVLPLVVAHFALDAVSFIGYPLALAAWPQLFG